MEKLGDLLTVQKEKEKKKIYIKLQRKVHLEIKIEMPNR